MPELNWQKRIVVVKCTKSKVEWKQADGVHDCMCDSTASVKGLLRRLSLLSCHTEQKERNHIQEEDRETE